MSTLSHPAHHGRVSARAFSAFGVTFSFLVMLITGAMIYVAPKGSLANQIDWSMLGLSRGDWEGVHIATAALFLLFGAWHFLIHLRIYRTLLSKTPACPQGHRLEAALALVLVLVIALAAVTATPPSSWLVDGGEYFKKVYWALDR